jgi:hypothetical protein
MIQNYDKFQNQTKNLTKFAHFKNSHLFNNDYMHNILGQIYRFLITNFKIFHWKIPSYGKVKKLKMNSQSFYKVISLVPLNAFAPELKLMCHGWVFVI